MVEEEIDSYRTVQHQRVSILPGPTQRPRGDQYQSRTSYRNQHPPPAPRTEPPAPCTEPPVMPDESRPPVWFRENMEEMVRHFLGPTKLGVDKLALGKQ